MKPIVVVKVGANRALRDYPGAICRIDRKIPAKSKTVTVKENESETLVFDTPGTVIYITPNSRDLPVTIINKTSVSLVLETRYDNGNTLDDVLKHTKEKKVPYGTRMKVTV